jgi:hypothetical protein
VLHLFLLVFLLAGHLYIGRHWAYHMREKGDNVIFGHHHHHHHHHQLWPLSHDHAQISYTHGGGRIAQSLGGCVFCEIVQARYCLPYTPRYATSPGHIQASVHIY